MTGNLRQGDLVYIKATVDKAPEADRTMYRVLTADEGTAVWVTKQEIVQPEGRD